MDENLSFGRPCCKSENYLRCVHQVFYFFLKNFLKGCLIKVILLLVSTRNLVKVKRELTKSIPRFGLAIGLMSGIFQLALCLLHKLKRKFKKMLDWLQRPTAYLLAGLLSGLPMAYIMNPKEQNIMKLFFFPLASRCVVDKLLEKGYLPTMQRHGDIVGYAIVAGVIGAVQITEKYSNSPSMHSMVQ